LTASDVVLRQIVSDLEALAKLAERALQSEIHDPSKADALNSIRDLAARGAAMARDAIDKAGY